MRKTRPFLISLMIIAFLACTGMELFNDPVELDPGKRPVFQVRSVDEAISFLSGGGKEGDFALQRLASVIKDCCLPGQICARFGGDELFSVIIGDCNPEEIIRDIDDSLRIFNKSVKLPYTIATSTGAYTTVLNDRYEVLKALKLADEKMYAVKNEKRARGDYITRQMPGAKA